MQKKIPYGESRKPIDFALCNQTEIVTNGQLLKKADIVSDHRLVRMALRMSRRLARLKTMKKQKSFNINAQKHKDVNERFEIKLKVKFEKELEGEVAVSKFSES